MFDRFTPDIIETFNGVQAFSKQDGAKDFDPMRKAIAALRETSMEFEQRAFRAANTATASSFVRLHKVSGQRPMCATDLSHHKTTANTHSSTFAEPNRRRPPPGKLLKNRSRERPPHLPSKETIMAGVPKPTTTNTTSTTSTFQSFANGVDDAASRTGFQAQYQAITAQGQQDMLDAAKMQNALNRTQMLAKLMEAGPKAAKDLIS